VVDMSPGAVSARLRTVAELLSARGFVQKGVDMSTAAVTLRLRTLATLSDMCARLGRASLHRRDEAAAPSTSRR
jgi:hypothetical protein